jgi:hypothetical protein
MVELDDFMSDLAESSLLYLNAMLQCWLVEYCRYKATAMLGSASREILIRTTNMGASLKNSKLTVFHKSAKNFSVLPRICHASTRKSSRFESTPITRACIPLAEDMTLVALGVVAVFEKLFP